MISTKGNGYFLIFLKKFHCGFMLLWTERKDVFWQGVFDGVTGIVRKPIEGAQKEGVEGFFKGKDSPV